LLTVNIDIPFCIDKLYTTSTLLSNSLKLCWSSLVQENIWLRVSCMSWI